MSNRCLYASSIKEFLEQDRLKILGTLHSNYHGESLTTTDDAWLGEIDILLQVLLPWKNENAQVISNTKYRDWVSVSMWSYFSVNVFLPLNLRLAKRKYSIPMLTKCWIMLWI